MFERWRNMLPFLLRRLDSTRRKLGSFRRHLVDVTGLCIYFLVALVTSAHPAMNGGLVELEGGRTG